MKIKKLAVSIMATLGIWAFGAGSAQATTWYVRDGGGTTSQCTGTTNAVYSGSGSAQPCAFNHPAWAIGTPGEAAKMVSGDTLYIVGDSDVNPGAQAQYIIGYGMPNTVNSQCSTSAAYQCIMSTVPAGTSSSALTHILGIGTHQPQLWGTEGVQWILNLTGGGNYDIENLEITQHSSCSGAVLTSGVNFSIYPAGCGGTSNYPYGPSAAAATWAQMGIDMEGTNITTKNLWVHNFAYSSINFDGNVGNWNSTNDRFIAAGDSLTQSTSGLMTFSGNNTMTNDVWAWGGCMEKYPLPDPGNVKDINNYINCADQGYANAYGGYALGGGFMQQNDNNGACGNWTISYSQFLFNLKTNVDFLHCNGTGTVNVYRSRFEGSTGESFKASVAQANLEESQFIANAPIWESAPFQALKAPKDGNAPWDFIICRGDANTVYTPVSGEQINYINDDLVSNCSSNVQLGDNGYSFNGCSGTSINAYNTMFLSGYAYDNAPEQTNVFYNGGSDGDGGSPCGTGSIPFNVYNSDIYNNNDPSNCTSGHNNLCATDPKIVGESTTAFSSLFGPTSYYEGTNLGDQLYLQSSSPLIGKATTNVTFTNGSSNDYNNVALGSSPSIGAIQYNSCIANATGSTNGFCSISNECCGGTCSSEEQCSGGSTASQPVVSITSPTSGISITTGSNLTISATASETGGTITNISIYNGSTLLGSSSVSLYDYIATNIGVGIYTFTAKATDAKGVSTTSSPIIVTVLNESILPSLPVVTVTSPASGSSFTAGSNVTVTTTASEDNGTISSISLYNGSGILLGTSSKSPYNYIDSNLLAGTYTFFAVAKDTSGISTTSSSITVTVTPSSSPVVAITSPVNGSSIAGSTLNMTASASEAGGTIAQVQFYEGSDLLATETKAPYTYSWTNVPAGAYIYLTAKATDTNGVSTTSSPVTATLTTSVPVVSITSPVNGSTIAGSTINITATASESGGTIAQVQFYEGSALLATDTTAPYSYTWTNVPAGAYIYLTAKATDTNGVSTTSSPVTATITPVVPVVAITSPVNGSTIAGSTINITASASESGGTIAQVQFYEGSALLATDTTAPYSYTWNNVPAGAYIYLTAKATDTNGVSTTSSPVTATLTPSVPFVAITSPVNGSTIAGSTLNMTATASESGGTIAQVQFYEGSALLATDTTAPYSYTWNNVPAGAYIYLTAKATDTNGVSTTSSPITATLTTSVPVVAITSPVNGSSIAGSTLNMTATASESGGTIAQVQFYEGSALLATDTTAPYSYTWNNVPAGAYIYLTAKATDTNGVSTTSSPVTATLTPVVPVVAITSPGNGSSFTTGSTVTLAASASEAGGTIAKVQFYNGTTLLGTDTSSPYTYTWSNLDVGTYSLTAVATDSAGATGTSSVISITVNGSHAAPTVSLTSPANNASYKEPASIVLTASASASNATISKVVFYNGTTWLGSDNSSPYSYTWNNVPAGTYNLKAIATDSTGATSTSSVAVVKVIAAIPIVAITSPASGSSSAAGSDITITATATETNGSIKNVIFYSGSTLLGMSTSSPYSYTWSSVAAGTYSLTVIATDANGVSVQSSSVTVTVTAPILPGGPR